MNWQLYQLDGIDGIDLLHRISSNDFRGKLPAQFTPSLILNNLGKIEAYFEYQINPSNSDSLLIRIPVSKNHSAEQAFLTQLEKFTFSEKYQLNKKHEMKGESSTAQRIVNLQAAVDFEFHCDGNTAPLDIGLKNAIADQKGCYPGQEVIEKIIAIGDAAKRLVQLEYCIDESAVAAQNLPILLTDDKGQTVGQITSITKNSQNKTFALAVVRKTHATLGTKLFANHSKATIVQLTAKDNA
jgi:folate-binding protein YgfZ